MLDTILARFKHGYQAIPDPLRATMDTAFPGLPKISQSADLELLASACPLSAIGAWGLDLGLCNFCGACARRYPEMILFTNDFRMATDNRQKLIIPRGEHDFSKTAILSRLPQAFAKSFCLRSVSAGGCNACELELGASSNVNFDMGRYGIEIVASPRHADALILTGPVSANMAEALIATWEAMPKPKFVLLCGTCAISGGIFKDSEALDRTWLSTIEPSLYIPGCPAHPLSIIHGIHSIMRGL